MEKIGEGPGWSLFFWIHLGHSNEKQCFDPLSITHNWDSQNYWQRVGIQRLVQDCKSQPFVAI